MKRTRIQNLTESHIGQTLKICGWIRTVRSQKKYAFIEINDGSMMRNLQIIVSESTKDFPQFLYLLTTGASICVKGRLVKSPGAEQTWEVHAQSIDLIGSCPAEYPLQKKRHSFEFLRTIAHLRARTNTQSALLRVRSTLAFATHLFFQQRGFLYVHTPILTTTDCEGGGEQFLCTTLDLQKLRTSASGEIDFSDDFFGKPAYLTVSGQLNGEALACAMSDIYTFGPTFRAENSNTSRHLAEFWMIEPEMAFADLEDDMECAEEYLKFSIQYLFDHCQEEMNFFEQFIEPGLIKRLRHVVESSFARLTYTEAIQILENSGKSFTFPCFWGADLQSEHERYLAEEYCGKPVILTDYPQAIKAFYMRRNSDDRTVAAMDLLVPKIGEIIGGSQREERLDLLQEKIEKAKLSASDYWWYLQLREYGTVPHAGFGAGFERLLLFLTGIENIRDVIPFPRFPGHADF
jgi:asparaginyl-tRNA synthetase